MRIQIPFAQADGLGCHLDQLIIINIGNGLFQRHLNRRGQPDRIIGSRRADIGELFALKRVYLKVIISAMFSDNHALINRHLRADKHTAPLF